MAAVSVDKRLVPSAPPPGSLIVVPAAHDARSLLSAAVSPLSPYMYRYMYICIYIYIYIYIHIYVHIVIFNYIFIYIESYEMMHEYIYAHI